jgi:uncharacterized delta-60 repeat protein
MLKQRARIRTKTLSVLAIGMLMIGRSMVVSAAPADGTLDPTFGTGGRVTTDFGASDSATDMALQLDGKIVVVGQTSTPTTGTDFAVARYNRDGSLDATFGTGGLVRTDFGTFESGNAVALQLDGKIVVAGNTGAFPETDIAIARYNRNGSLDQTFGNGGLVITSIPSPGGTAPFAEALDVAVALDGKIIVVGSGPSGNWVIARYTRNGQLDPSFNGTGIVVTDFGSFGQATSVALQFDGRIVVGGITSPGGGPTPGLNIGFALARFNHDGSLDANFGNGGLVETDVAAGVDRLSRIAIQLDGKIVAVGDAGTNSAFAVVRYHHDGSLDARFGTGGIVTVAGQFARGTAVALQFDGKIVVAGSQITVVNGSFSVHDAVLRFEHNGELDDNFGTNGLVTIDFPTTAPVQFSQANGVAVQLDGKIVVAGSTLASINGSDFTLARLTR